MAIPKKILCPHCHLSLAYDESAANAAVRCIHCGEKFIMPDVRVPPGKKDKSANDSQFWLPHPPMPGLPTTYAAPPQSLEPPAPRPVPVPPMPTVELIEQQFGGSEEELEYHDDHRKRRPMDDRPRPLDSEERSHWRAVLSGLGLILYGYLISLGSFFITVMTTGPMLGQFGLRSSNWNSSYSMGWVPALFCLSGGCFSISLLLVIVGQSMCCSAPTHRCRTPAVASLLFLIVGSFIGLFLALFLAATSTPVRPRYLNPAFLYVMFGLAAFLVLVSHIICIQLLREIATHFQSKSTLRQANYYQVFILLYTAGTVLAMIVSWAAAPLSGYSSYSRNRPMDEIGGILGVCWAFFGLFVTIAFLTLLSQTRSLIKDRITAPKPTVLMDE